MAVTAALADANYRTGTASIASVPFGTAAAGRVVFSFVTAFDNGAAGDTQFALTLGGVAGLRQDLMSGAAVVATGTTGTVASASAGFIQTSGVYALSGNPNPRPALRFSKYAPDINTPGSLSVVVAATAGSTIIAQTFTNTTTAPTFTSGVTSDGSFLDGFGNSYRVGHADQASAGNVTVTCTGATQLQVYMFDTSGPNWSLIGCTNTVNVSSGNLNLSAEPSGTAQDDILVATIAARGNAAFSYPSGWAAAATAQNSGNTTSGTGGIASGVLGYAIRGASTPASFNFTRTGGGAAFGRVLCFRSSTAGTPSYDAGSSATAGSSSASVTTTAITGAVSEELVVGIGLRGDTSGSTGPGQLLAATTPAAMGTVASADRDATFEAEMSIFAGLTAASGSTGTFTASGSGSNCRMTLLVAMFQPPGGSPPGSTAIISGSTMPMMGV